MKKIQINLYRIGTNHVGKISLPCFDYKKYILDDSINSVTYFHEDTKS